MPRERFPLVLNYAAARCFKCAGELRDHHPSDFAAGVGAHRAYCARCDLWTWFDLLVRS